MNFIKAVIMAVLVPGILLAGGCGSSGVSQADYDAVKSQLADCQAQLAAIQGISGGDLADALKDLQADYDALNYRYEQLKEEMTSSDPSGQLQAMQDDYDELNAQYEALQKEYAAFVEGAKDLSEEDISQAILKAVNDDRVKEGLAQLDLGTNIAKIALSNCRAMADLGDYQYSSQGGVWQRILIASRPSSAEQMANAALEIWKNNTLAYKDNVLNPSAKYGAVAALKSGSVYYVTFVASPTK